MLYLIITVLVVALGLKAWQFHLLLADFRVLRSQLAAYKAMRLGIERVVDQADLYEPRVRNQLNAILNPHHENL